MPRAMCGTHAHEPKQFPPENGSALIHESSGLKGPKHKVAKLLTLGLSRSSQWRSLLREEGSKTYLQPC